MQQRILYTIANNSYQNGIPQLVTPRFDAKRIAEVLKTEYDYQKIVVKQDVGLQVFRDFLEEISTTNFSQNASQVVLYYAGHGIAQNKEDGSLEGFLVPSDASPLNYQSFLPMGEIYKAFEASKPHHLMIILDCCFAGAFRWAYRYRDLIKLETLYLEQFHYYLKYKAWQVLTSSSYDEKAIDYLSGNKSREHVLVGQHSPFAHTLIRGLQGEADLIPDNIITASELQAFLESEFLKTIGHTQHEQTPSIDSISIFNKGQFVFVRQGDIESVEADLEKAPGLSPENNPYKGLEAYKPKDDKFFYGREQLIDKLETLVANEADANFVVVTGPSGTGKSSLVQAGLVPRLSKDNWECLIMRPTETPIEELQRVLIPEQPVVSQENFKKIQSHFDLHFRPGLLANSQQKKLLIIDQFEEITTLAKIKNKDEQSSESSFIELIHHFIRHYPENFCLLITIRSDYEPRFLDTALKDSWEKKRMLVGRMRQNDFRQAILEPAKKASIFFQDSDLIEHIINEVEDAPGALPLLSFTLEQLYLKCYHRSHQMDAENARTITWEDYKSIGGVTGSITRSADAVHERLSTQHERQMFQSLLLRMVSLKGGERAKRRVFTRELRFPTEEDELCIKKILQDLLSSRLIVTGTATGTQGTTYYEPAHDELVRGWSKINTWLEDIEEENFNLLRRLTEASQTWENNKRKGGLWDNNTPDLRKAEQLIGINSWWDRVKFAFAKRVK